MNYQIRSYDNVACLVSEFVSDAHVLPHLQPVSDAGVTRGEGH